ncbi:MAG TPA: hypothetical protein VGN90_10195 [Pyrinomonadaceae bacterium]|nr:hypothetical protein [Pyrinomonadaceae bacterium]
MRQLSSTRKFIALIVMALLLAIAAPTTSFAKGQNGRWRSQGDRDWNSSRWNRKCGKFVNCHDARDGRWDRRGARGDRVGNFAGRSGYRRNNDFYRTRRVRTYNNNRYWWRGRR